MRPAESGFCRAKVVAEKTISATPMVEAMDESLTRASRYEVSEGSAVRTACGARIRTNVVPRLKPSACAASLCPPARVWNAPR